MEHFDIDVALLAADFVGGKEDVIVVCAVGVVDFDVIDCIFGKNARVPVCWLMLEAGIEELRRYGIYLHRRARPKAAGHTLGSRMGFGL